MTRPSSLSAADYPAIALSANPQPLAGRVLNSAQGAIRMSGNRARNPHFMRFRKLLPPSMASHYHLDA
jgi:hypothetical protein